MKNIIKFLFFVISTQLFAQEIGFRLGGGDYNNMGLDGVVNLKNRTRLHGNIAFGKGVSASMLYDFKISPISNYNFQYYFGAGASMGNNNFKKESFLFGVNGETGIEYVFKRSPITIGLDWRPQLNLTAQTKVKMLQFGLNIRYRIIRIKRGKRNINTTPKPYKDNNTLYKIDRPKEREKKQYRSKDYNKKERTKYHRI